MLLSEAEVTQRVAAVLRQLPFVAGDKIAPTATFADLRLDELHAPAVHRALENEFCVCIPEVRPSHSFHGYCTIVF